MTRELSGYGSMTVPYITAWSEETDPPCVPVELAGRGIGYADETLADRDRHGVLWLRTLFRPGQGRPVFGKVHPTRQRRAMQRLLCQVCACPADRTEDGVLWLLRDFREDWPSWPNGMATTEPPICRPCVQLSIRLCPALRKGSAVIRARSYTLVGVDGLLYRRSDRAIVPTQGVTVAFEDPAVHWVRAACLARQLHDCEIVPAQDLTGHALTRLP